MSYWSDLSAKLKKFKYWSQLGHAATVFAAITGLLGLSITSCSYLGQQEAAERENRRNWKCEFLYHQEEKLPELVRVSEGILTRLHENLDAIQRDLFAIIENPMDPQQLGRLAKDSGLRATIVGGVDIEPFKKELETLREMFSRQDYLFEQTSRETVAGLIDELVAILSHWELPYSGRVRLESVEAKLIDELKCVRLALRRTCNPDTIGGNDAYIQSRCSQ